MNTGFFKDVKNLFSAPLNSKSILNNFQTCYPIKIKRLPCKANNSRKKKNSYWSFQYMLVFDLQSRKTNLT